MSIKNALKAELLATKNCLIAREQSDPIRADFAAQELALAKADSLAARTPPEPLKRGLGGEIIPPSSAACLALKTRSNRLIY